MGAPNFFDRKAEIGGAVYVYLNPFGHWDDQARPIRLNGTYDSMFGMTVSSIGDLDQDGYGGRHHGNSFSLYLAVCISLHWGSYLFNGFELL